MSQVIACPNCDKKLAVKDELIGCALICPQCKGRFTVPADEPVAEGFGLTSGEAPTPTGSDMDFLDSLAPARVKTAAKTSPPSFRLEASPAVSIASRKAAIRAKKRNNQMMIIYIGGGIAAAVLVVILFVMAMPSADRGGRREKVDENMRFGLPESQRKRFFKDLFHAVDENGVSKACRVEWRRLGSERNLNDEQISAVLQEGLDHDWEQPELAATMDQKQKTNRQEWIRMMNETHREPIMSQ